MNKLNPYLPIILIDTSYWLYYRFFALRNWYSRAYPELYISNTNNFNYNWFEDELFMCKYKKLFVDNIKKICKQYKTKLENVILCFDCPHNEIWRHNKVKLENKIIHIKNKIIQKKIEKEKPNDVNIDDVNIDDVNIDDANIDNDIISEEMINNCKENSIIENIKPYKGTRLESHKKNKFNSFNIFDYMKYKFIPTIKDNNNNNIKIINCSKCEADDIIGHLSLYIDNHMKTRANEYNTYNQHKIYILANDNDYLQVCNNNIKLINGLGNIISGNKGENYYGDKYLISKILLGDKSDNIRNCTIDSGYLHNGIPNNKFKNVTKKCLESIFDNTEKYTFLNTLLNDIRTNINNIELDNSNISIYSNNKITTCKYIDINTFIHNCNMMDFQMLPEKLKDNLYSIFTEII